MIPLHLIKKRFQSGAYDGIPEGILQEIRQGIAAVQDEWDNYPGSRSGILARLYQTKVCLWTHYGSKLYWKTCQELDRLFLPSNNG